LLCWHSIGNGPLSVALTQNSDDPAFIVDVVNVQIDQLTHPDTRGVKHLEQGVVAKVDWITIGGGVS
jgi:hypothetical protein